MGENNPNWETNNMAFMLCNSSLSRDTQLSYMLIKQILGFIPGSLELTPPPPPLLEIELTSLSYGYVCCMDCEEYFKPRKGHFGKDYCLSCISYFTLAEVRTDIKSEFKPKDTTVVNLLYCTDCKCIVSFEGLCDNCHYKKYGYDDCYDNENYNQLEEEYEEEESCCYNCDYGGWNVGCVRGLDRGERE